MACKVRCIVKPYALFLLETLAGMAGFKLTAGRHLAFQNCERRVPGTQPVDAVP